jgi:hypothetical protein
MRSQVSPLSGLCSLLNFVELSFMFSPIGLALRGAGAHLQLSLRSNVLYSFHLSSHVLLEISTLVDCLALKSLMRC